MLGFKRRSLGSCPQRSETKILKDDAASIYEFTLHKILAGGNPDRQSRFIRSKSESVLSPITASTSEGAGFCGTAASAHHRLGAGTMSAGNMAAPFTELRRDVSQSSSSAKNCCLTADDDLLCFHCGKKICVSCSQQCSGCQEEFCNLCSLPNFSERHDRVFCLDCQILSQNETKMVVRKEVQHK